MLKRLSLKINRLKELYFSSVVYSIYTYIRKKVLTHPLYLFFTDFSFVSALWHKSFIYKALLRKVLTYATKLYTDRFTIPPSLCIYTLFPALLLPPDIWNLWQNLVLVLAIQILSIRYAPSLQLCCDFLIFLIFYGIFLMVSYIIVSPASFSVAILISSALTIYYLMSILINDKKSLNNTLFAIFLFNISLCLLNATSYILDNKFINNRLVVGDIIILTTPASVAFLFRQHSKLCRYICSILTLLLTFTVIIMSSNIETLIGYCVAVIFFTAFSKPEYLLVIFLVFPGIVLFSIYRFLNMWTLNNITGSGIEEILYTAINFWNNGLGFGTDEFLQLYNTGIYQRNTVELNKPFLLTGRILLFVILWYTLKIIRSAIFNILKVSPDIRHIFLAILSSIIGFSVSILIGPSSFEFENTLCYWMMLGILSAQIKLAARNGEIKKTDF